MDESTSEVRHAHDQLAELYAERFSHHLDQAPVDRAVLDLFCEFVREAANGRSIADIGCGAGRLGPYLAAQGLEPHGVDLSPEMVRVARRDHPGFPYTVGDVRDLPFDDSSLAGVVCWYSLMYLPPAGRAQAFGELARVTAPGGYLVTAFKAGDDQGRRGGRSVGVEFDVYWHSHDEVTSRLADAGFSVVFTGGRPRGPGRGTTTGLPDRPEASAPPGRADYSSVRRTRATPALPDP